MSTPQSAANQGVGAPVDAPGAAEGTGAFRPTVQRGLEGADRSPLRRSEAGRRSTPGAPPRRPPATDAEKDSIFDQLTVLYVGTPKTKGFESDKDFLYGDLYGNVTVGIGHLVAHKRADEKTVRKALADIPLVHVSPAWAKCSGQVHEDHKYQSYQEVVGLYVANYDRVLKQGLKLAEENGADPMKSDTPNAVLGQFGKDPTNPKNKLGADAYANPVHSHLPGTPMNADLRLEKGAALELFRKDFDKKYAAAISHFPEFTTYPIGVRLVIVDILFNGTKVGGEGGWEHFQQEIKGHRWKEAATHAAAGIDKVRDRWRRSQILRESQIQEMRRRMNLYGGWDIA